MSRWMLNLMASQAGVYFETWGGKQRFYFSWIYDCLKNSCFLWQDHEWFICAAFVCFFSLEYMLPTDCHRQEKAHIWRLGLKVQDVGFRCILWWGRAFKQLNTPRFTHSHIITWNLKKVNALYRAVVSLSVLGHMVDYTYTAPRRP